MRHSVRAGSKILRHSCVVGSYKESRQYEHYIQRGEGLQLYRQDMPVTKLLGSYSNKL